MPFNDSSGSALFNGRDKVKLLFIADVTLGRFLMLEALNKSIAKHSIISLI